MQLTVINTTEISVVMHIFSHPLLQVFIYETEFPSSILKITTEQSLFQKHWNYSTVKLQKEVPTHKGINLTSYLQANLRNKNHYDFGKQL